MSIQPVSAEGRVVLTDIDISFGRLVIFFIKAGLAAVPAAIIIWIILMLIFGGLGMLFGFGWWMHGPSI